MKHESSDAAVVVDAGVRTFDWVTDYLVKREWRLAGVLATHGHVDHIGNAAHLANTFGVPLWIHSGDEFMMRRPSAGLGPDSVGLLTALLGSDELPAPDHWVDVAGCDRIQCGGMTITVTPAPGHSPGCVLYGVDDPDGPVVFTGDVVFAGSIGRTDLPGGDASAMSATLSGVVARLDDRARLLPGHGPATTMARERVANPYLQPGFC